MKYALANMLNGGGMFMDPAAKAYITALKNAGATVSGVQSTAINNFIRTGRRDGWYSSIKKLFLPIWGTANPNAVDMILANSGTYTGGVNHASGYVQGDGTSGVFDTGTTVSAVGMTTSSGYIFALVTQASTLGVRGLVARSQGVSVTATLMSSNASQAFRYNTNANQVFGTSAGTGIISASREGGNRSIYRRITSGRSVLLNAAGADFGTIPTGGNIAVLAVNNNGGVGFTTGDFNNARLGAFGVGLGLNNTDDTNFTAALKTLWETCTGLTLP